MIPIITFIIRLFFLILGFVSLASMLLSPVMLAVVIYKYVKKAKNRKKFLMILIFMILAIPLNILLLTVLSTIEQSTGIGFGLTSQFLQSN